MATVGGKLFYASNSKKFMNHSCTNSQFPDILKAQPSLTRALCAVCNQLHLGPLPCWELKDSKGGKVRRDSPNLASRRDRQQFCWEKEPRVTKPFSEGSGNEAEGHLAQQSTGFQLHRRRPALHVAQGINSYVCLVARAESNTTTHKGYFW